MCSDDMATPREEHERFKNQMYVSGHGTAVGLGVEAWPTSLDAPSHLYNRVYSIGSSGSPCVNLLRDLINHRKQVIYNLEITLVRNCCTACTPRAEGCSLFRLQRQTVIE